MPTLISMSRRWRITWHVRRSSSNYVDETATDIATHAKLTKPSVLGVLTELIEYQL